jgi:hypothetical protein
MRRLLVVSRESGVAGTSLISSKKEGTELMSAGFNREAEIASATLTALLAEH